MPTVSNVFCPVCEIWMKNHKSGAIVEEAMTKGGAPYKLWSGDMYECPQCLGTVIVNFGAHPIAEHFQPDYHEQREKFRTNDADYFFSETNP
jgi:hypothetical protein